MEQQSQKPVRRLSEKTLREIIGAVAVIIAAIITTYKITSCAPPPNPTPTVTLSAALTPTASATITPSPSPTLTVTDTSTPSSSPTISQTAEPPAKITSLTNGDNVTQFVDLIGSYSVEAADKPIWIFVQDQAGNYWIESMDVCNGSGTPKINGKWEIFMGVGVADSEGPYNIVLTVADDTSNNYLITTLKKQCKDKAYTGLPILPSGLSEIQRIKVNRQKVVDPLDAYGPVPELSDAGLSGLINLTYPSASAEVSPVETVSGTVTGVSNKVWVLVHTFYGKWFPQSNAPCIGDDTHFDASGGWSVKTILGGDQDKGKPFDVVVVLANEQANQLLDAKQKADCLSNNYTGFFTIELPPGISEKYHMRYIRK